MQRHTVRLYDLRDQRNHIAAIQRTSLSGGDMGLAPDPLVGSDEWREQIRQLEGTITRAYWASNGRLAGVRDEQLRQRSLDVDGGR